MTVEGGPYLAAALLCEKVLIEKDGVLSAIRLVDRVVVTPGPGSSPEQMPQIPIQMRALIMLKSGFVQGKQSVKLTQITPSQEETPIATLPVLFEGNDRGVNLNVALNFAAKEEGLYWFGVHLEDQLLTRIPLRILYQRLGIGNPIGNP